MKAKTIGILLVIGLLAGAVASLSGSAQAGPPAPTVVGTDPEGDWATSDGTGGELAPLGAELGQDLVEAAISMPDKENLNFIITVTSLPSIGGWPEITRYSWAMTVDGTYVELDGKFTNYSRGACDPTSQQCPPPRDPGEAPFLVRGNCTTANNVQTCEEIGLVHAEFDAAAGTITVPVPLELIKAKPGSKIGPAFTAVGESFGASVLAQPSAFVSYGGAPADGLAITTEYVIPSAKQKKGKKAKPTPTATPEPSTTSS